MALDYTQARALGRELVLPTFVGIGAQKAGTTWVWENLKTIDSVFMPKGKEIHFFDMKIDRPLTRYSLNFQPGEGMIRGEITPAYSVLPLRRVCYVAAAMPDARLFLLIRNPIDRAWSHARMAMPQKTGLPVEEVEYDVTLEFLMRRHQTGRGMYTSIVDTWTVPYDRDQLLIGLYDDIMERPRELLTRILDHIGVTEEPDWDRMPWKDVIHQGASAPMPERLREELSQLYADEIHRCIDRFGAPESWLDALSDGFR